MESFFTILKILHTVLSDTFTSTLASGSTRGDLKDPHDLQSFEIAVKIAQRN